MQVGVFTPVLLLLLSAEHGPRVGAFRALESFLIRRMVCRQTTKDYNRLALELAIKLEKGGLDEADKIVTSFLKEQKAYSREWPTDHTVADSLESFASLSPAHAGTAETGARRNREPTTITEGRTA